MLIDIRRVPPNRRKHDIPYWVRERFKGVRVLAIPVLDKKRQETGDVSIGIAALAKAVRKDSASAALWLERSPLTSICVPRSIYKEVRS